YDPEAMNEAEKLLPGLVLARSAYDAIKGADAMVIITEWDQFRALDLDRIKTSMRGNVVVDLRNIYRPEDVAAKGFAYSSIGRPKA
ncbi:MAG: UDP binding domain-containing protein, partial [Pseudomonadota bacterium]